MLTEQIAEIRKRIGRTGMGLKDALSVIDMTFQDQIARLKAPSPYQPFTDLNKLIDVTVHGAKIGASSQRTTASLSTLEIRTEEGEGIGYLNMMYRKKFIPCYYLVYVEVMPSFRGLGLGDRILNAFMEFVRDKKAVGLLDNIIPPGEVTFEIYSKLGWRNIKDHIGNGVADGWGNYMVFVPDSLQAHDLKDKLVKFLFDLSKKRPVIDMHDNEDMVKRTIEEFRSVYRALEELFDEEISSGASTPLMRFMFTRLTTKLIGFRRRIATLIGYTGGESLEQISFSERIKELSIQPYSLWDVEKDHVGIWGDKELLRTLPGKLKEEPTLFIEGLPTYKRPYLHEWMEKMRTRPSQSLKISDLLDLGFDPTRLREFHHEGVDYVFERISPHLFASLVKKRRFLRNIGNCVSRVQFAGAILRTNPPLLIFRDRGNIYALRKKLVGINSDVALDKLITSPYLKVINRTVGIDRPSGQSMISMLVERVQVPVPAGNEDLLFFPWILNETFPVHVDISGVSLETIWIA
jgi:GNAT superfamily N-acetyltransferase